MKVLKEGNKKEWGLKVICSGAGNGEKDCACGAELMAEEGDIFKTSRSDYGGGYEEFYTIECPCCKTWTDIDRSKIPSFIRDKAGHRSPSTRGREPRGYGD